MSIFTVFHYLNRQGTDFSIPKHEVHVKRMHDTFVKLVPSEEQISQIQLQIWSSRSSQSGLLTNEGISFQQVILRARGVRAPGLVCYMIQGSWSDIKISGLIAGD